MCVVSAILRWTITIVDYLSLSLIAFSRFFMLSHPRVGKVVFTGRLAQLPLAGMWILGIIAISPFLFAGVSSPRGKQIVCAQNNCFPLYLRISAILGTTVKLATAA